MKILFWAALLFMLAGSLQAAAEDYPTGARPPTPEEARWLSGRVAHIQAPAAMARAALPKKVTNIEHLPRVRTQLLGNCG